MLFIIGLCCFGYRRVIVIVVIVIVVVLIIDVNVFAICIDIIIIITEVFITTNITTDITTTIRTDKVPPLELLNQLYQTDLQPITTTTFTAFFYTTITNTITNIITIIAIASIQVTILPQHFHLHILTNNLLIDKINKLSLL